MANQVSQLNDTSSLKEKREIFRAYVEEHIAPCANQFDRDASLPSHVLRHLAQAGFSCATIPTKYGGSGMSYVTYGLLSEELGRACSSVRNIVGVQGMVAEALLRYGSEAQKQAWLPAICRGDITVAFALTEPAIGSDAAHIKTTATETDDGYLLNGTKKWISYAEKADLYLVFAQLAGQHSAFLAPQNADGITLEPLRDLLGFRASHLATLIFEDCFVPREALVGRAGFGMRYIATSGLQYGRYSTSWGAVGLMQGCLEASWQYVNQREQFGSRLHNYQLVKKILADMVTRVQAGRNLCLRMSQSQDEKHPDTTAQILMAKYFTSQAAEQTAQEAVQLQGAAGVHLDSHVQRYFRDAKIFSIVEGTTQIQSQLIGDSIASILHMI